MGAAAYIGRVGSLAVALGVGTAIATGSGVAVADDTASASSTSASSNTSDSKASDSKASAGSDSTTSDTKTSDTDKTATPAEPTSTKPETKPAESTSTPTATTGTPATSTTSTTVGDGVVVSAQSTTGSSGTAPSATPDPTAEPKPTPTPAPAKEPAPEPKATHPSAAIPAVAAPKTAATATAAPTAKAQNATAVAVVTKPTTTLDVAAAQSISVPTVSTAAVVLTPVVPALVPRLALPTPIEVVRGVVSSVVGWALGPLLGSGPAAPAAPPLAWSLLAFARREFDDFVTAVTGRTTQATAPTLTLAAATTAVAQAAVAAVNLPGFPLPGAQLSPSTQFVQWLTGNYQTGNPLIADTLKRFGIDGTDVGVTWDNGMVDDPSTPYDEHQVLMAFGDTFSGANMTGNWRFNVLLRSADTDLSDGETIPNGEWFNGNMFGGTPLSSPTTARQIIHPDGLPAGITLIPTAGVSIPTPGTQFGVTQYLNFMSVTNWGAPGTWTTNYSAIAYSTDNGENWTVAPTSVRYNDPFSGNAKFQQGAFVRPGDGYVYGYGTPNGRQGAAYVSRVAEKDILDTTKYEYYSKGSAGGWFGIGAVKAGWYKNQPAKASAMFGQSSGACGVAAPGTQVSEMSVQYNKQLNKYVVLYGDQFNNIVMRTSDTPQGTWSAAKVLMAQQSGGIYAPMMHPWSPSTMGTGTDLYWNLSLYSEYNVMLMKTDLTKV